MGHVINSHPAWHRQRRRTLNGRNLVWPISCTEGGLRESEMAEVSKGLSQEYWRPAPTPGNQFKMHGFQVQGNEGFCTICGTSYAPGALFCHLCGLSREDDLRVKERNPIMDWLDLEHIREQSGLSTL